MKTDVSKFSEFRKYYLSEFEWFDGEEYITFNLVGIDLEKGEAQVAVTDRGKISVITYDLMTDKYRRDNKKTLQRKESGNIRSRGVSKPYPYIS